MNKIGIFSTELKPSNELYIFECGYEHCEPRDPYQYEPIDYYLIHYILEGEGLFFINDQCYHLKAGDGFFIPPDTANNYYALEGNPWVYRWIGVNGIKAKELFSMCGFKDGNFLFRYDKDDKVDNYFRNIYECCCDDDLYMALGYLYQLFSLLKIDDYENVIGDCSNSKEYIHKAIDYIKDNYYKSITVSDVSNYLTIDRSYFYKIFKESMMTTPQQYIIEYRIEKACSLLRKSSYSISKISNLVGFSSQAYFSKVFKKTLNITPFEYRKTFIK